MVELDGLIEALFGVFDDGNGVFYTADDARDLQLAIEHQRVRHHLSMHPFQQSMPHVSQQDQRPILDVSNLQQLPDHECLQRAADSSGQHDVSVRKPDEMVKARKKCAM